MMSKLNKNAKEFKPTLDVINELLYDERFRLPNIIPNPDYKVDPTSKDFGSQPIISFIMPMATGKTYYTKKYGLFDIDMTRDEKLEEKMKPLVAEALETGDWSKHNAVWFDHTIKWFKVAKDRINLSIIFTHSIDHALALGSKYIIPLKLHRSAWFKNLKERRDREKDEEAKKRFDKLSSTNWDSVKGTMYPSREQLEYAIVKTIELICPFLYQETIAKNKPVNNYK